MSIFGLGSCKHQALTPAVHVTNRDITALTKQFKEIRNTPINAFTKDKITSDLKELSSKMEGKLTTVKDNRASHNSKKLGQLSKISSDLDGFIREKGLTISEKKNVTRTPEQRNEALALAEQRKRDKNDGIDMGGMVR